MDILILFSNVSANCGVNMTLTFMSRLSGTGMSYNAMNTVEDTVNGT